MAKTIKAITYLLVAISVVFASFTTAFAEASPVLTGNIIGNGKIIVNGEEYTEGISVPAEFTVELIPGAANTLTAFSVNGESIAVSENKVTVSVTDDSSFEAVFDAAEGNTNVSRSVEYVIDNGTVSADTKSVTDPDSKLKAAFRNYIKQDSIRTEGFTTEYGYEIKQTMTSKERGLMTRSVSDGGLIKIGLGRTYAPYIYFKNTHPQWNVDISGTYGISTGKLNDTNSTCYVNNNTDWYMSKSTGAKIFKASKNSVGKFNMPEFTASKLIVDGNEITDKSAYSHVTTVEFEGAYCGGIDQEHMYIHGVAFDETAPYHSIKADIGEGVLKLTSKSLNFGTDNDDVVLKNGNVAAVEHYMDASFEITPPSGKTVKTVTWTPSGGEAVALVANNDGLYTIASLDTYGIISAEYNDVQKAPSITAGDVVAKKNVNISIDGKNIKSDYTVIMYGTVDYGNGYTVTEAGFDITDSKDNALRLKSQKSVIPSVFAIRVIGEGLSDGSYSIKPYIAYNGGEATGNSTSITLDSSVEEYSAQ